MSPRRTVGMASARRSKRRGSTLIMALLLVIVLSATVAGLFGMLGSERKSLDDQEAQAGAYDIARSAYDRFLAILQRSPASRRRRGPVPTPPITPSEMAMPTCACNAYIHR